MQLPRRTFLQVGALGGLGLTLGDLLKSEAIAASTLSDLPQAKAKSVIQIFLPGGIAHQEFVDPKPEAPSEYRGEMDAIATAVDGLRFNELLTETAKVADRLSVIHSLTHTEAAHERGVHNMLTGYRPSPAITYPSIGSVVASQLGDRNELPSYICAPTPVSVYAGSGYLSSKFGPFSVGSDPARRGYAVRDLALPEGVTPSDFERRRRMLDAVEGHFRGQTESEAMAAMDAFYQKAYDMLSSDRAIAAFDLNSESSETRDRYGRSSAGARFLLARRLIEAGVRFISTSYGSWDTHAYHFRTTRRALPAFDQGFAALIQDLEERGLLESTLVVVCTEFGRTPKVNDLAGRDHWPQVFSALLAGGGLKQGYVHGASDALAAEPAKDPVSPEDLAKTIYHLIGIDAESELMAPGARPLRIVNGGSIIQPLLA